MEQTLREQLVQFGKRLVESRLVTGTGGNLSLRVPGRDRMLITPSSVDYWAIGPEDIVEVDLASGEASAPPGRRPSVEWLLHAELYRARSAVNAVVHFHGLYTRALSVARQEIPVILDGTALYVGGPVRVAPFAPSGSAELARNVAGAIGESPCILMANHGAVAVGGTLQEAFALALRIEEWAHVYLLARQAGAVHALTEDDIVRVREHFGRISYKAT